MPDLFISSVFSIPEIFKRQVTMERKECYCGASIVDRELVHTLFCATTSPKCPECAELFPTIEKCSTNGLLFQRKLSECLLDFVQHLTGHHVQNVSAEFVADICKNILTVEEVEIFGNSENSLYADRNTLKYIRAAVETVFAPFIRVDADAQKKLLECADKALGDLGKIVHHNFFIIVMDLFNPMKVTQSEIIYSSRNGVCDSLRLSFFEPVKFDGGDMRQKLCDMLLYRHFEKFGNSLTPDKVVADTKCFLLYVAVQMLTKQPDFYKQLQHTHLSLIVEYLYGTEDGPEERGQE